jgi:hypothetical protein
MNYMYNIRVILFDMNENYMDDICFLYSFGLFTNGNK